MTTTGYTVDGANNTFVGRLTNSINRITFEKVVSGGVDSAWGSVISPIGTGMTVNQSNGSLVITTGTTINQDTIVRSNVRVAEGGVRLRHAMTLSQRIANQSFFVELVDVIGDGLATTVNSATSVTVNIPGTTFTSANVGQAMYLGGYVGTGALPPQRAVIASVAGSAVTYTVAGATAGTGVASVFGWNYYQTLYDGTSVNAKKADTQRRGYASGFSSVSDNSSSSGTVGLLVGEAGNAQFSDTTANAAIVINNRATRTQFVPDDVQLYVQVRAVNGTTAPASSTTWTINYIMAESFVPLDTATSDIRFGAMNNISTVRAYVEAGTISIVPASSASAYTLTTAATTNAGNIKTSAGSLIELTLGNPTATPAYVKLYNKASAPTVGTDIPVITFPLPANSATVYEFGVMGKRFSVGIGIAVTAAIADTDTANAVAGAKISATFT